LLPVLLPTALSTRRLIPIALLPVNYISLLVGEGELLPLLPGQFCPTHIRIREIARLKTGAAKVGISQVRPHEIDFAENRSTKITSRKVGVSEVDLVEVIPAKRGLGQVCVLERDRPDLRPAKESASESQVVEIAFAYAYPGAEEPDPKQFFIFALGAVAGYGWDHTFGSCTNVVEALE